VVGTAKSRVIVQAMNVSGPSTSRSAVLMTQLGRLPSTQNRVRA
jgi:hypothetical protein